MAAATPQTESATATVLIVDDTAYARRRVANIATEGGFNVVGEAENGEEAVALYAELQPDIVTMDITMPVMDGITSVAAIRKDHPDACIVMCSAISQEAAVIEAIGLGASDFVIKPFIPERLIETLTKAVSRSSR